MSSKFAIKLFEARRWSLTTRLTLFFSAAIAFIVIGVSAMMYHELVHQLREKEELELKDDVRIQHEVFEYLARKKQPTQWQHEWGEHQEESKVFAWQLMGADGSVLSASSNIDQFAVGQPRAADYGHGVRISGDVRMPGRYFLERSIAMDKVSGSGTRLRGILEVSRDERVLQRYFTKLSGVVALAIVLATGIGWALARRGLAPVRAISADIGRINAEKLHARIANEAWPAELRQLALSFDDMLARLERSFEQLSRFSSDLAHEFRSPINNLVAAASVTLGRARDASQYQNTLEVVIEEGNRLSRMVSSMLFLARADNAEQALRMEPVSTEMEFQKLVEFFEISADDQGVTLQAEGECHLMADPLLLRRALSNLLTNALRYTPRGGAIVLKAQEQGDAVLISVCDNGAGIAPEHLPYLFDRFYRVDAARSATDSTGLGLAVVRSIAELHGGGVSVRSQPGQGACFEMRFPTRLEASPPKVDNPPTTAGDRRRTGVLPQQFSSRQPDGPG
jgi:two-component system heavy metal sensor histidine kinase CusS